jgi:hypothetical protein
MKRDLVTSGDEVTHDLWMTTHSVGQEEERRVNLFVLEQIEKLRRPAIVGTVIDSQRHSMVFVVTTRHRADRTQSDVRSSANVAPQRRWHSISK